MSFNVERLIPRAMLRDKDGYALAKAIERAFEIVDEAAQTGIDIIQDPEKMPEWRLDELAQELGCLYDYSGTLAQKRYWVSEAVNLYAIYGTPQAIMNFLEGVFPTVRVEEDWQMEEGLPYHFTVTVAGGDYGVSKIAWAQKVVERVKNVRSVLDGITIDSTTEIIITPSAGHFDVLYLYPSDNLLCGDEGQELNS